MIRYVSSDNFCAASIPSDALAKMVARCDDVHPLETGSVLVGHYSDDNVTACVDVVADTPPDSEQSRYRFQRGTSGLAEYLKGIFEGSDGGRYYIGEFHSHPGGEPVPSKEDDEAQFSIAKDPLCQCAMPLLVIVGGEPGGRQIGVYAYSSDGRKWPLRGEHEHEDGGP